MPPILRTLLVCVARGRVLLIAYLLVLVAAMFLEDSLIFFPVAYPDGDWQPRGLAFEDAWFQAADGTRLHGWYVPHAERPGRRALLPRQRRQHHASRRRRCRCLHDRVGVSVLIFDYRGYGRSEGKPERGGRSGRRPGRPALAGRAREDRRDATSC